MGKITIIREWPEIEVPAGTHWAPLAGTDQLLVPGRFTITGPASPQGGAPTARVVVEVIEGRPQCVAVHIERQDNGRRIVSADLQHLPLKRWIGDAVEILGATIRFNKDGSINFEPPASLEQIVAKERDRKRALTEIATALKSIDRSRRAGAVTDDLLEEVATVYRAAKGKHPTQAVMDHFPVTRPTASRWIRRARDRDFLGPSRGQGKAGEEPRRG